MRLTTTEIGESESLEIGRMSYRSGEINDKEVANDFSKDVYSLFRDGTTSFKGTWDVFADLREMYVKWRIKDLNKSLDFYMDTRKFLKEFTMGETYRKLKQLPPMEALSVFLGLFNPPPGGQCDSGNGSGDGGNEAGGKSGGNGKEQHSKKNLPIDIDNAKKALKTVDKIVGSGLLDDDGIKGIIRSMGAGESVNDIDISTLNSEKISEISRRLSDKELDIFRIARHKELIDVYKAGTELSHSEVPDNELSISKISNASEFFRVIPQQMALEDDVFFLKLAKNELLVREYMTKRQKKQALYLLVDVSGSMSGIRSIYASATALSFVRQAIKNQATYFLRFFDFEPSQLERVETVADAEKIGGILLKQPYSGGGTSISKAVIAAISDIKRDKEKFDKVEIMLITDGDDWSFGFSKRDLGDIKLHSTIIDGENAQLKELSETYTRLNTREIAETFGTSEESIVWS